jgi:hypothetical protein
MSVYIDKKYVSLLAPRLKQFKQRGEFLWNFRCPLCGDSHKNTVKARGYIYRKKNFGFMCHNCGASMSLREFLKDIDPMLYREYQLEKFREDNPKERELTAQDFKTKPVFDTYTKDLETAGAVRIKSFPPEFFARKYLEDRKIDLIDLYYTNDFGDFVRRLVPAYEKKLYKEERIIIPFYDKDGNLMGVQGRAVGKSDLKYITIKLDESLPKIYGWNKVDVTKPIKVVEGPLDARFLSNALATMDASLHHAPSIIGLDYDYTMVYDNEPRSKQITQNLMRTIDRGYKVCIWPNDISGKDINDMVLSGLSPSVVEHIIDQNTYQGLSAKLEFNRWSKV